MLFYKIYLSVWGYRFFCEEIPTQDSIVEFTTGLSKNYCNYTDPNNFLKILILVKSETQRQLSYGWKNFIWSES